MNQQPLRIVLVRSAEARERLGEHLSEGNRKKTAAAPLVAVLAADDEFHERNCPASSRTSHRPRVSSPSVRCASVPRSSTRSCRSATQFIGVRAAGLAAGPMTGFDAEGIDKEFFSDGEHSVLVVVNIGRPGENAWFTRSPPSGIRASGHRRLTEGQQPAGAAPAAADAVVGGACVDERLRAGAGQQRDVRARNLRCATWSRRVRPWANACRKVPGADGAGIPPNAAGIAPCRSATGSSMPSAPAAMSATDAGGLGIGRRTRVVPRSGRSRFPGDGRARAAISVNEPPAPALLELS